jgi:hypothetical protein
MSELPGGWLPPQPPSGPPAPPAQSGPQPPVFVRPPGQEPTSGLVIAALVCSIASLALLMLSLGLSFFFSLPLGVAGWVCATRARRDAPPGRPKAALVLSVTAVALSVLAAVVWVILLAAGFSIEELQRSLEQELERQRRAS